MAKVKIDVCDVCGEVITGAKNGIEISGENIAVAWAGRNSPEGDPFDNNGVHIPMNGRVTLTVCKPCLISELELIGAP
ncbi:MAG TPA: hypothetical protein VI423_09940 [Paenisporosarcina sp.]|nr:hypothetical protein [Paenisporosarcina sp.]